MGCLPVVCLSARGIPCPVSQSVSQSGLYHFGVHDDALFCGVLSWSQGPELSAPSPSPPFLHLHLPTTSRSPLPGVRYIGIRAVRSSHPPSHPTSLSPPSPKDGVAAKVRSFPPLPRVNLRDRLFSPIYPPPFSRHIGGCDCTSPVHRRAPISLRRFFPPFPLPKTTYSPIRSFVL